MTEPHQAAVGVLSRGDHIPTQRHAHGGSCVCFMSVQQGGAVHTTDQIQTQEMLQRKGNTKHPLTSVGESNALQYCVTPPKITNYVT